MQKFPYTLQVVHMYVWYVCLIRILSTSIESKQLQMQNLQVYESNPKLVHWQFMAQGTVWNTGPALQQWMNKDMLDKFRGTMIMENGFLKSFGIETMLRIEWIYLVMVLWKKTNKGSVQMYNLMLNNSASGKWLN